MFLREYVFFFTVLLFHSVLSERGCPPVEDIVPCTCTEYAFVDLICENITETNTLTQVFKSAERYEFKRFTLRESSLQYIPHVVFDDVNVVAIDFEKLSFVNTFDTLPRNPGVKIMYFSQVRIIGGWDWTKIAIFSELEDLTIDSIPMKKLSTEFRPNVSKKLKKLRLSWCKTKKFQDNEFEEFVDLEVFTATHDELTTIKRSMFARPSKLKELSFEYNRIDSIPADMFSEMPDLFFISFGNNRLSLLPENIFKPLMPQLQYLRMQDNPFKCDCRMEWIVWHSSQVKYFYGRCESPKKLARKNLVELTASDFRC